jgi:threonine dehydrogenase-like Zn-dependent dehydrogenase
MSPTPHLIDPSDAIVAVSRACICGSDLWPYRTLEHSEVGHRMGHEAIGIVEAVGADVRTLNVGDVVVMPIWIGCSTTEPGLMWSGQFASATTRVPPSYSVPLPSR